MSTQENLLASAQELEAPTEEVQAEYRAQHLALAEEMNRLLGQREDLEALIGPHNRAMMEDNHRNHARFMESLFTVYSPEVFVETVLWVFRAYRAHGFRLAYWPAQLDTWVELLRRSLSEGAFAQIYPFYRWMLVNQAAFAALSEELPAAGPAPDHGS